MLPATCRVGLGMARPDCDALWTLCSGAARPGRGRPSAKGWQIGNRPDKRMTRPSCPLAAPHFAPSSSSALLAASASPSPRAMSNSQRGTSSHPQSLPLEPPLVPAGLPFSPAASAPPGSPFLFASWSVHTPHQFPSRTSSLFTLSLPNYYPWGIKRFHLQSPCPLVVLVPLPFRPSSLLPLELPTIGGEELFVPSHAPKLG